MTFLPIVERELRTAARRPITYWMRSIAALAAMAVAVLVVFSESYGSTATAAKVTFGILSSLLMVFCLFAGIFQTADCLSSEKREGTLGLLFLTDLHGYDVVLGKLTATSLGACYALISMLPVLAIPLLAGGVTVGEFWRVVLVLLAGLFTSLGVGMFVSAATRESRQSLGISVFIIVFTTGLLPAIHQLLWLFFKIKIGGPLLWPSLGFALNRAFDGYYNYRTGPHEFWGSLFTIVSMGAVGLLAASFILPQAWQEKSEGGGCGRRTSRWRQLRFGGERRRRSIRRLLTVNPFRWLAVRDRVSAISFWMIAGVVMPIWLLFMDSVFENSGPGFAQIVPFELMVAVTFGLSLICKCLAAVEVSRRLSDDRRSGALELLLVTPLTERDIVEGQRRALRDLFWGPLLLLEVLFASIFWVVYSAGVFHFHENGIFGVMMVGNMIVLLTDMTAIGWTGVWTGIRSRNHHRAVLSTLARILFLPWLLYFVLGVLGFFDGRTPVPLFVVWFTLCVVNDLIWVRRAQHKLKLQFRSLASGEADQNRLPPVSAPTTESME